MLRKSIFLVIISTLICSFGYSQGISGLDSLAYKDVRRNTIKWNITPMIWNITNINFGYERTTSNTGSFTINAGYFVLPTFGVFDSINIKRQNKKWGFSLSGDKRWYFKKRNTKLAPDGIYIGVYGSIHYYDFENSFEVINSDIAKGTLDLTGKFGIFSAGVELGYQFVFKNNISLDLIFIGPSLSTYTTELKIAGDLAVDKESEYIQALYDVLISKFPGADRLIDEKALKSSGTSFSFGPGFRYMIQIGYRF